MIRLPVYQFKGTCIINEESTVIGRVNSRIWKSNYGNSGDDLIFLQIWYLGERKKYLFALRAGFYFILLFVQKFTEIFVPDTSCSARFERVGCTEFWTMKGLRSSMRNSFFIQHQRLEPIIYSTDPLKLTLPSQWVRINRDRVLTTQLGTTKISFALHTQTMLWT